MQAMILAAGFGTRLLPYTKHRPKPLFPVLNTPFLTALVRRLKNAGFSKIIVNCHHLAEQIISSLEGFPEVIIQHEETILGTGGGLRRALDNLDDEPLLVVNGDIYHSIDVAELYHYHQSREHELTLAVHDYPRFNKLGLVDDRIVDFDGRSKGASQLAYTGVQVINPALLAPIKKEAASCIIEHYRNLLANKMAIHARRYACCTWADMGTVEDYLNLHGELRTGRIPCWPELGGAADGSCIDSAAECADDLEIEDWACIGRARIGSRVKLSRCVVWDDAVLEAGAVVEDAIVIPHN